MGCTLIIVIEPVFVVRRLQLHGPGHTQFFVVLMKAVELKDPEDFKNYEWGLTMDNFELAWPTVGRGGFHLQCACNAHAVQKLGPSNCRQNLL